MRKQHLKKHSQWFEKPCWRGVPDYSQFVSQPTCLAVQEKGATCPTSSLGRFPLVSADFWTSDLSERPRCFLGTRARGTRITISPPRCLERVDARLSLCARDRANLLDAAAAAAGIDDDKQLEPYETMGDFAAECKRIFDNALAYNERYRNDVRNAAHEVCKSADLLVPVLDEALFALALEGYERVKREEILLRWDKSTARGLNVEAAERREEHLQQRAVAKRKIEEMAARDRTSTRAKREKLLRVLGRAAVVSLDVLDAAPAAAANGDGDDEGPDRPALPEDPAAAVEAAPLVAAPGVDVSRRRDAAAKAVANAVLQALGGGREWRDGAAEAARPRSAPAPIAAADHRRGDGAVAPFSLKKPAAKRAKRAVPDAFGGEADEPDAPPPPVVVAPAAAAAPAPPTPTLDASCGDSDWCGVGGGVEARVLVAATRDGRFARARVLLRGAADFGRVACAPAASGDAAFQRCAALRRDERCRRALASVGGGARLGAALPRDPPPDDPVERELLVGGFLPVGESRALLATQPEATRRGGVDGVEAAFFFVVGGARLWIGGLAVVHEVLA